MAADLEHIQGNWTEFREKLRAHYSGLDEDEAEAFRANRAQLLTLLETRYGMAGPGAERELDAIMREDPDAKG